MPLCSAKSPPQAFYHRQKSRWTPWQDGAGQAKLEQEYRQRLAQNHTAGWAPDPRAAPNELLALCSHRERPFSTVRQVSWLAASRAPTLPLLRCSALPSNVRGAIEVCGCVVVDACPATMPACPGQVLLDTPAAVPRRHRLLVRLVDYQPRELAGMCHPAAACGLPGTLGRLGNVGRCCGWRSTFFQR